MGGRAELLEWQRPVAEELLGNYFHRAAQRPWTQAEVALGSEIARELLLQLRTDPSLAASLQCFKSIALPAALGRGEQPATLRREVYDELFELLRELFFSLIELYASVFHSQCSVELRAVQFFPDAQIFPALRSAEPATDAQEQLLDRWLRDPLFNLPEPPQPD